MKHVSARAQIMELLLTSAKSLVDLPEHVSIEFETQDDVTAFKIDIHKDDRGNLMGRAGSNMRAMRQLADSIASRGGIKVVLVVCE